MGPYVSSHSRRRNLYRTSYQICGCWANSSLTTTTTTTTTTTLLCYRDRFVSVGPGAAFKWLGDEKKESLQVPAHGSVADVV